MKSNEVQPVSPVAPMACVGTMSAASRGEALRAIANYEPVKAKQMSSEEVRLLAISLLKKNFVSDKD